MSNVAQAFYRQWQITGNDKKGIAPLIPVSRSTWLEWVRTKKAPQPVKLSENVTAWRSEDIHAFIAELGKGA